MSVYKLHGQWRRGWIAEIGRWENFAFGQGRPDASQDGRLPEFTTPRVGEGTVQTSRSGVQGVFIGRARGCARESSSEGPPGHRGDRRHQRVSVEREDVEARRLVEKVVWDGSYGEERFGYHEVKNDEKGSEHYERTQYEEESGVSTDEDEDEDGDENREDSESSDSEDSEDEASEM